MVFSTPPPPDEQEHARIERKLNAAFPIEAWETTPLPKFRLGRPGRSALAALRRPRPGETPTDRIYTTWLLIALRGVSNWILLEVRRGEGEGRGFDVKFDRRRHSELLEALATVDRMVIADATDQHEQPITLGVLRRVLDEV